MSRTRVSHYNGGGAHHAASATQAPTGHICDDVHQVPVVATFAPVSHPVGCGVYLVAVAKHTPVSGQKVGWGYSRRSEELGNLAKGQAEDVVCVHAPVSHPEGGNVHQEVEDAHQPSSYADKVQVLTIISELE